MYPRLQRGVALACGLLVLAACTRLKPIPTAPAASPPPDADVSPVPFPSDGASPGASADPAGAPRLTLTAPTATADFAGDKLAVSFSAQAAIGRAIASARIEYQGALVKAVEGPGPYQLDDWNPHVDAAGAALGYGDRVLRVVAVDDTGVTGSTELPFHKPLRLGAWSEAASLPSDWSMGAVFADGAEPPAYVALWGSADGAASPTTVATQSYAFNPAGAGSWSGVSVTGGSTARALYASARHPATGKVYLLGGRLGAQDQLGFDIFDPLARTANPTVPALGAARREMAAVVAGGFLYAIGGEGGAGASSSVERIALDASGNPTGAWQARAPLALPRAGANAVVVGSEVWVFGGGPRTVEAYDPATDTWKNVTAASGAPLASPEAWSHALMLEADARFYFFGGAREDGTGVDRVHEFSPQKKAWRDLGPLPAPEGVTETERAEARMGGFFAGNRFYLVGGVSLPGNAPSRKVFKADAL